MKNIFILLENDKEKPSKSNLALITAATKLKKVHSYDKVFGLLMGGKGVAESAKLLDSYGLSGIYYVGHEELTNYLAFQYQRSVEKVIEELDKKSISLDLLMIAANSRGKDLAPRLAALLNAGMSSDTVDFLEEETFKRPIFAGNILAEIQLNSEKKVVSVRTSNFDLAEVESNKSIIEELNISLEASTKQTFLSYETAKTERPQLGDADIIVSGGRALKSKENFEKYIYPLAEVLDAAIGASRAAVDSGYAPNDWQVGQTGKVVAPKLYIAVGISGAIQHLAGMKDSKVIVAINKNKDEPIFEVADYGLVGDLFEELPKLTELIKNSR